MLNFFPTGRAACQRVWPLTASKSTRAGTDVLGPTGSWKTQMPERFALSDVQDATAFLRNPLQQLSTDAVDAVLFFEVISLSD